MSVVDVEPRALAGLTTLRVGGTPQRMIDAHTRADLIDALRDVWDAEEDLLVVGGGSNLFVGDGDLPVTAVRVLTQGIERLADPDAGVARVRVEAGHMWDDFVGHVVDAGLAGVEALSGIPGTVGAAPVQNIGAYGQEIVQTLVEVELIDADTGEVSTVSAVDLGLGFRTSVLKAHYGSIAQRDAVILTVTFDLRIVGDGPVHLSGSQLRTALGLAEGETTTLAAVRDRVRAIRASKGMVLDDTDPDTYSAGSFFQNAIVPQQFATTLPDACPRWPVAADSAAGAAVIPLAGFDGTVPPLATAVPDVKVSAAWLIEHAGLSKGFALPGAHASLSTKHTLALTNRGDATAEEIAELARYVRARVQAEYGLTLQPEPVLVGVEI